MTFIYLNLIGYTIYSQNSLQDIERDVYYNFNDLLPTNSLNDLDVKIKFLPSYPSNGCTTKNFISFLMEGYLRSSNQFISFDIYFKDCYENLFYQTISIPLSRNEFSKYLNIPNTSDSRFSNVLGIDNSNFYNNDFSYVTEKLEKISNVRLTDFYISTRPRKASLLENPERINISNEPGEENTKFDRAEYKSRVTLSLSGGKIPDDGSWTWYADEDTKYKIGTGASILYYVDNEKPDVTVYVVGSTKDGKNQTDPVTRKVFIESKQILLTKIDKLINSNDLNLAFDLITGLKDSYYSDSAINNKYNQIKDLIEKKAKAEDEEKLKEITTQVYDLSDKFPYEAKAVQISIYNLFNTKLFNKDINNGNYLVDINVDYKKNDKYYFSTSTSLYPASIDLNKYIVDNLNSNKNKFESPRLWVVNKYYEINAFEKFKYNIDILSTNYKLNKKGGVWVTEDLNLKRILIKNYDSIIYGLPNGKYSIDVRKISLDGTDYYQTSGEILKTDDGPNNVFKSIFIPSLGRKNVGLKNGNLITFSIIGLATISVLSKIYSNNQYSKFLAANDQVTLDKSYENANIANKAHLISAGLGITIYSINLVSVFSKGRKNKANYQYDNLPFKKNDIVAY